jgi:pimeloyl-ACP methyl ester carboxylesterase
VAPVALVAPAARIQPAATPAPAPLSLLGVVQGVVAAVVVNVGSLTFNAVQAVEALVTGPPVLPPGSTVTVRSSTVQLSNGQRVAANWYYPETVDGAPPPNMILLQHGFFALGPMYSYTAANLAQNTNSVVVSTTLSSNPFAGDDFWLGGTGMSSSIADLFVGDRSALTASADDAGYAAQYGLDPVTATLPRRFALAGHSLGANLVSGAAGFLVDKGAADDLVGVILLDGVPVGTTLPDALTKLDAYAASDGGHYVPVREIGAPLNLYNFTSTVNADLSAARPDRFNGVVLDGGVHSDSMSGGNPLIQLALYLAAGFPQPQNPPAVDELSVQWFNEWFAGDTAAGDGLVPGSTVDVPTPRGTAHGVVIGNPPGAVTIAPTDPTAIPAVAPTLATIAA